jgi:hypothetical protein
MKGNKRKSFFLDHLLVERDPPSSFIYFLPLFIEGAEFDRNKNIPLLRIALDKLGDFALGKLFDPNKVSSQSKVKQVQQLPNLMTSLRQTFKWCGWVY